MTGTLLTDKGTEDKFITLIVCMLCSGSGLVNQSGGVQCQEQVLSDGDGDGGRSGSLQLHRPAQPPAPGHRQYRPAERHCCTRTGTQLLCV